MSDSLTGVGGQSPAGGGGIVRGNGHAPGQNLGEAMPDIPQGVKPAALADFRKVMNERNQSARGGQQQPSARNRVADFSKQLEAKQQAPSKPGAERGQEGQQAKTEQMGDPNQVKEPGNLETPPAEDGNEQQTTETDGNEQQSEPGRLSDQEALARYREWEQSDMFPEDMAERWKYEVKTNGIVGYVDTKELKQGYIRGVDHRRGFAEAQAVHQRAAQERQQHNQHWEDIKDPQKLLDSHERRGYGDTLLEVARIIARRDQKDRMQVNGAGYAAMQQYGTNDPNDHRVVAAMKEMHESIRQTRQHKMEADRVAYERQQLQQAQQDQHREARVQEHHAVYERQLNQLRPLVFKAFGMADNAKNRGTYLKHLGAVIGQQKLPAEGITRELAMLAGRDMAEERESEGGDRPPVGLTPEQWARIQKEKAGRGDVLPPSRTGGGGGQPRGQLGGERKSLRDLENMVRENRFRGR